LEEPNHPDITLHESSSGFNQNTAIDDLEDIDRSDTLLFFSEDPLVGIPRGGRHVEFGYALGTGKRVCVVGGHENVFHFLPEVVHYFTLQDFLEGERIDDRQAAD
jgi:hypothetical protein